MNEPDEIREPDVAPKRVRPTQADLDRLAEAEELEASVDAEERQRVRLHPISPELTERQIAPVLSDKEYRDQIKRFSKRNKGRYQTPAMGKNEIEPNIVYWDWEQIRQGRKLIKRKQIKFLLLPKALPNSSTRLLDVLERTAKAHEAWKKGSRSSDGQKHGTKISIGWFPQLPGCSVGSGYYNVRTAATLEHPEIVAALFPMLKEMDQKVHEKLPAYYQFAWAAALHAVRPEGEEDDLSRVQRLPEHLRSSGLPDPYGIVKGLDPWDWTYTLKGTIFSTVELNRNIIFKAHEDGNNVNGTCVCITTLGTFVGGRLVFPRYGYSAELGPTDLLICDNNKEAHGNLGPIVGERFSVVAFLYSRLYGRTSTEEWETEA